MSLSEKIRAQLIHSFRVELAEHIQTMTDGLLGLEQHRLTPEQEPEMLQSIFRAAHSLKGAARAVGVTAIEQLAHALEGVLEGLQQHTLSPSPELFSACYHTLDIIQAVQNAYEAGAVTPPTEILHALAALEPFQKNPSLSSGIPIPGMNGDSGSTSPDSPAPAVSPTASVNLMPPADSYTIRIQANKLDTLLAQLSELHVARIRTEQRMVQVHQAQDQMGQWQKEWLSVRESYNRLVRRSANRSGERDTLPFHDTDRLLSYLESSQERLRSMSSLVNHLVREYTTDSMQLSMAIDALEEDVKRARLLPFNTITAPFGRMVRDLAQVAGKSAALQIVGNDVELDKRVLEQIKDPLIHLLRNAVDHGIESPEQRLAVGKSRNGHIVLKAEQVGKEILLSVSDDGKGLDLEAIRRVAVQHGQGDTATMTEADLAAVIFHAGVSTSKVITDVSGRGVGLDVVRRNVEALQGRINVTWQPDAGSTFTLVLPLALTSSRALMVKAAQQAFAIPVNAIERIISVKRNQIFSAGGHETLQYNGAPLPIVHLCDVFGISRNGEMYANGHFTVLILASAERKMAFVVSELVGEQEVVIKGLGRQIQRVNGIAGATILGNGDVLLILNVSDLIKLALRGERCLPITLQDGNAAEASSIASKQILVVDDSITTRTLEKNILEAAGFVVWVALDGQEALARISGSDLPDLVISDVSMPRVTGIELTRFLKNDPRTAQIPVILVTSLDSAEDKARGIEAGADAYIIKSHFDQDNLLDVIYQLI